MTPIPSFIEQELAAFEFDSSAHRLGNCSFNVTALCAAEEHRVKDFLRHSLLKTMEFKDSERIIAEREATKKGYEIGRKEGIEIPEELELKGDPDGINKYANQRIIGWNAAIIQMRNKIDEIRKKGEIK